MIARCLSCLPCKPFVRAPRYSMSMLNDYLTQKQVKKQETEFKKEMEYLANKPNFTLMDYKQRIEDELSKIKSRNPPYSQSSRHA